jgi:site-specific DNA-methyltransferase (cytosine-N4-specific)
MLPLVDTLARTGRVSAKDACDAVADGISIHPDVRQLLGHDRSGSTFNLFDRRVRWVRQSAVGLDLVAKGERGYWQLTAKGEEVAAAKDSNSQCIERGTVVTLYTTSLGSFLWGHAEDVISSLDRGSVNLVFTSPPYPLLRKKEYGNLNGEAYLNWLEDILGLHLEALAPHASLLVNLGEAYEQRGSPALSTYREELTIRARKNLGLSLFGKYYWHNPSKPPAGHWVTHAKCRPKNDAEEILWFAKTGESPRFYGENALRPYGATMRKLLERGGDSRAKRPSGHGDSKNGFSVDRGGSWPGQVISLPNAASNGPYFSFCRDHGLPPHPARFPEKLAHLMVSTHSQKGDLLFDPFGGSGTMAEMAEALERRWVVGERDLNYSISSIGRFTKKLAIH